MELLWDFSSLSNKRVEVRTRTTEEIIAITPVLFAGSETAPDSIRRGIPMPESLSNALSLIRESEDIFHHLPKTIRSLVEIRKQSDDRSANKIDAPSLNSTELGMGLWYGLWRCNWLWNTDCRLRRRIDTWLDHGCSRLRLMHGLHLGSTANGPWTHHPRPRYRRTCWLPDVGALEQRIQLIDGDS